MKKIFALASAVMLAFCLAVPVYADTAESTVTSETTSEDTSEDDYGIDGDALADDAGDSIDTIHNEITNQKDTLGGVFEGFSQVSQFMGYTVGYAITEMPMSFTVYLLLVALLLVILATINVLKSK